MVNNDSLINFSEKYGLTAPHSEVINAIKFVASGRALDLGCGNGRNSLFLSQKGFHVTAVDKNPASIANLQRITIAEHIENMHIELGDLNSLSVQGEYAFILSTVVMMFLQPDTIPRLIAGMQGATVAGGYNLIVAAMDTPDYPCTLGFPFTFKPGELLNYYQGWQIVKYNEDVGQLHRTDATGKRISLRFATLLARR